MTDEFGNRLMDLRYTSGQQGNELHEKEKKELFKENR